MKTFQVLSVALSCTVLTIGSTESDDSALMQRKINRHDAQWGSNQSSLGSARTPEGTLPFKIEECTTAGGCVSKELFLTIDQNWRWYHNPNTYQNCENCDVNDCSDCVMDKDIDASKYRSTYKITVAPDKKSVSMGFPTGSRSYLLDETGERYYMFSLVGKEFTFDVDVSKLPCGMNGALYWIEMDANGGVPAGSSAGNGAQLGMGYCDAQCPTDPKTIGGQPNTDKEHQCCNEFDIWEANRVDTALTAHPCLLPDGKQMVGPYACQGEAECMSTSGKDSAVCDGAGCDWNPYRNGNKMFYGNWSGTDVDTTKPFTVTTQLISDADGTLTELKRFYIQNDKKIVEESVTVNDKEWTSLTDPYCKAEMEAYGDGVFLKKGGLDTAGKSLDRGNVLAISVWNDPATHMEWLDGTTSDEAGGDRGPCGHLDQSMDGESSVIYSNFRWGDIGSTTPSFGPTPPPTPPPPTPPTAPPTLPSDDGIHTNAPSPPVKPARKTPEGTLPMKVQECTVEGGCVDKDMFVTIDQNWRWYHNPTTYANCEDCDVNDCSDCVMDTDIDASSYKSTYKVEVTNDNRDLNLGFPTGSRLYLLDESGEDYYMFSLVGQEFTFEVDVSKLPCGMNGALYWIEMDKNGGVPVGSSFGNGAQLGAGYCDAQCPTDQKTIGGKPNADDTHQCCNEFDIWEANRVDTALTPHPCLLPDGQPMVGPYACNGEECDSTSGSNKAVCDGAGCDFNPYRDGDKDFYGNWSGTTVDTNKPFTVTTQMIADEQGKLKELRRIYIQDGKKIEEAPVTVNGEEFSVLNDKYCIAEMDAFGAGTFMDKGGLKTSGYSLNRGNVLALSVWNDPATHMTWLDGETSTGAGGERGPCGQLDQSEDGESSVIYSNLRWGEIGSTTLDSPSTTLPVDTTSPPTPTKDDEPTPFSNDDHCAELYTQCGGESWTGATCCVSGGTCQSSSQYYSQCLP